MNSDPSKLPPAETKLPVSDGATDLVRLGLLSRHSCRAFRRACLGFLVIYVSLARLQGQEGTLLFETLSSRWAYPVMDCQGPISGPGWSAQVWIGPPNSTEAQLVPLLPTTTFSTTFPGYVERVILSAESVGFWQGTMPTFQIRVWNNEGGAVPAFSNATVRGASPLIQSMPLGGNRGTPALAAPKLPASMVSLGETELIRLSGQTCVPQTNQSSYEVAFIRTNLIVSKFSPNVTLSVRRNLLDSTLGPPSDEQSVQYVFEDVTAEAGRDYEPNPGRVVFSYPSVGQIRIAMMDDPVWRGPRIFRVRLTSPGYRVALGQPSVATVTITDDDTVLAPHRRIDGPINAMSAVQGKRWLVAGDFTRIDGLARNGLARLEFDGSIDPSYAPGADRDGAISLITEEVDGSILLAGDFGRLDGANRPLIARLGRDGTVDRRFVPTIVRTGVIRQVLIQPDRRIIIAGSGLGAGTNTNTGVLRLENDGSLDVTFTPPPAVTNVNVVALQADGKILVAGPFMGLFVRLNVDGLLDSSFRRRLPDAPESAFGLVTALTVAPDGRILVGGSAPFGGVYPPLVVLFTNRLGAPQGQGLDLRGPGFTGGYFEPLKTDTSVFERVNIRSVASFVTQPGGKILVQGYMEVGLRKDGVLIGSVPTSGVLRLNSDLTPDRSFEGSYTYLSSMTVQADGTFGGIPGYLPPKTISSGVGRIGVRMADGHSAESIRIAGVTRLPDGQIHFSLRGYAPYPGPMQTSIDLVKWETLTNSATELHGMVFKETNLTNSPQRFYRAQVR